MTVHMTARDISQLEERIIPWEEQILFKFRYAFLFLQRDKVIDFLFFSGLLLSYGQAVGWPRSYR